MEFEKFLALLNMLGDVSRTLPTGGVNGFHTITDDQARKKAWQEARDKAEEKIAAYNGKVAQLALFINNCSPQILPQLKTLLQELQDYHQNYSGNKLELIKALQEFSSGKIKGFISKEMTNCPVVLSAENIQKLQQQIVEGYINPGNCSTLLSVKIPLATLIDPHGLAVPTT